MEVDGTDGYLLMDEFKHVYTKDFEEIGIADDSSDEDLWILWAFIES